MTTQIENQTFDTTYEDWRPRLYRALVLATGDRDAALDAVDAAFSREKRAIGRANGSPPAQALGASLSQLTRKRRDYSGFRLPEEEPDPETVAVLEAVRSLDLRDRLTLVASRYLGWDDATVGRGLGMLPAEASQRIQVGTGRVLSTVGATDVATIDTAFEDAAGRTVVPLSRLEAVKRHARVRRVGTFAGVVALTAALGGGVLLAANTVLADDPDEGDGPTVAGVVIESASALGELEWNRAVLPISENGEMQTVSAGDEGYLALFMDYSTGSQTPRVFSSENGLDWEAAGDMAIGQQGGYVSQLTFGDGRWIAVGNAYDPASGQDRPLVMLSEDGSSWAAAELPVEEELLIDDITITTGTSLTSAIIDEGSITVFGTQWGDFDQVVRQLVPDDISVDFGWGSDSNGNVDIYDSNGNVEVTLTAEDLGIPPDVASLISGNGIVAYRSTNEGQTWEPLSLATVTPGWVNSVTGLGDTLLATVGMDNGTALYRLDGDEWVRVDVGPGAIANAVATFDGQVYAAGSDAAGGGAMWRSADGETWDAVDVPIVDDVGFNILTATPHGLIAVGQPFSVLGPAVVPIDDLTVSISAGGVYTVTDAEGNVVAEAFHEDLEPGGPVEILDPDTGGVVVTVEREAIDAAWQQVYQEAEQGFQEQTGFTMVASVDGTTWVRLPLDEVLPPGFYPNYQAMGPGGILLAGWSEQALPVVGGNGHQVWVGTAG